MQDLRDDAIEVLRGMLRAPRDADRLRAVEAILRATASASGSAVGGSLAELSDQALLEIAKGVHPREMGPVTPSAETVPSRAPADPDPKSGPQGTQKGPAISDTPPPGLVTPNPMMNRTRRGPKEDPQSAIPRPPEPWE